MATIRLDDTLSLEASSSKAIENYNPDSSIEQVTIYAPSVTLSEAATASGYVCRAVRGESGKWVVKKVDLLYVEFYDENGNLIEGSLAGLKPDTDPAGIIPEGYDEPVMIEGKYYDRVWVHEDMNLDSDTFGEMIPLAAMDEGVMSWYDYSIDDPMPVYLTLVEDTTIAVVTWMTPKGDVYKTEWYYVGEEIVHPTAEEMKADTENRFFEEKNNDWYDVYYTTWRGKNGENTKIATPAAVFVVDETKFTPVANIKGIRYNLKLTGNSTPTIYGPVIFNYADITSTSGKTVAGKTIPAEIEYLGFVSSDGTYDLSNQKFTTIGNTLLNSDKASVLPADAISSATKYIGFKVHGCGYDEVVVQTVTINFATYAKAVLDSYPCGSEEAILALSALNFINNNSIYSNKGEQTEATAILSQHTKCDCVAAGNALYKYTAKAPDNTGYAPLKAAGVHGAQYSFSINQPNMLIYIPEDKLFKADVTYDAATHGNLIYKLVFNYTGIDIDSSVSNEDTLNHLHTQVRTANDISTKSTQGAYYSGKFNDKNVELVAFRPTRIGMCNADTVFTITLYNYEGTQLAVGEYSIADFMDVQTKAVADAVASGSSTNQTTATKALNAAKGLYFFARAARDYKVWSGGEARPNVTVTFNSNGGTETESITQPMGSSIANLPTPTREDGLKFAGWFYEVGTEIFEFTSETRLTYDVIVTAQWLPSLDVISYDDFGAVGDGVTNDYAALYKAHAIANILNLPVKATAGKTYYLESPLVKNTPLSIAVKTDTDWCGASFIIDDRNIAQNNSTKEWNVPVFSIEQDAETVSYNSSTADGQALLQSILSAGLNRNTTKIDLGDEYRCPVMIVTKNATHKVYRRRKYSAYAGVSMEEVIILDKDGNISGDTPVMYDYIDLTGLSVIKLDEIAPITVKNAEFTTKASQYNCIVTESDGYRNYVAPYLTRGLKITRSFTTLENVKHYVTDEAAWNDYVDENNAIKFVGSTYRGFYITGNCTDVTIRDCVLTGRRAYRRPNGGTGGTYDLSLGTTNNVIFEGCVQSNFWVTVDEEGNISPAKEGDEGAIGSMESFPDRKVFVDSGSTIGGGTEIGAQMYWGIGGTNLCKNTKYINSTLSRYDAHEGTYGGEVKGSTVDTIALTGGGDFYIEDTRVMHYDTGVFSTREDYGYTWDGTVYIKNVSAIVGAKKNDGTYANISVIAPGYTNWYYGYHPSTPSIVIEDLVYYDIKDYDSETKTYAQVPADVPIYLYGTSISAASRNHLAKTTTAPYYSVEDKDKDGFIDIPDIDGDGVWGNTAYEYSTIKALLGRDYDSGFRESAVNPDYVNPTDGLYDNFAQVNPPKFVKVLSNEGGYQYYVRNTATSGISNGLYHGVEENYKGFYGSTKFYYSETEFYQGPPRDDEKNPNENLYVFFN